MQPHNNTRIYYTSLYVRGAAMKRMIGFILFWIAVGMTIMLFIHSGFFAILLIIICFLLSYHLFNDC